MAESMAESVAESVAESKGESISEPMVRVDIYIDCPVVGTEVGSLSIHAISWLLRLAMTL